MSVSTGAAMESPEKVAEESGEEEDVQVCGPGPPCGKHVRTRHMKDGGASHESGS